MLIQKKIFIVFIVSFSLSMFLFSSDIPKDYLVMPKNKLQVIPSFETCSVYFKSDTIPKQNYLYYKEKSSDIWKPALSLVCDPENKILRGSIVNLHEDFQYEVKLICYDNQDKKGIYTAEFKTWTSKVKIKKIVNLDEFNNEKTIEIRDNGSEQGWIKYIGTKVINPSSYKGSNSVINIENASFVILEGLTIQGGYRYGINIKNSHHIRIINCDISGWGRKGKQILTKDGKYYTEEGCVINRDCGINIYKSGKILVERCYIHDPAGRANSWRFSHPAGPEGITVWSTGGIVLRYNDFIGSDLHRWNDAVEGYHNGSKTGGFYRDSDIYGNMFAFGNDDGIELDGGQMNIRVYKNKFEGFLCGISTAPCLLGPSYCFRNLIVNLGDEDEQTCNAFKNSHARAGLGQLFIFNNTIYGECNGFGAYATLKKTFRDNPLKGYTRNNIYACRSFIAKKTFRRRNDFNYDLFWSGNIDYDMRIKKEFNRLGIEKNGIFANPNFVSPELGIFKLKPNSPAIDRGIIVNNFIDTFNGKAPDIGAFEFGTNNYELPYRPIPVFLDKNQLNFETEQFGAIMSQTVTAYVKTETFYKQRFIIRKNKVFNWFSVTPKSGLLENGKEVKFTVSLTPDKMETPGLYKGIFLIRQENGFSRPVVIYVKVHGNKNIKKDSKGFYIYIEAESSPNAKLFKIEKDRDASDNKCIFLKPFTGKTTTDNGLKYEFSVPHSGKYQILLRVKSIPPTGEHDSVFISLDGSKAVPLHLRSTAKYWIWTWGKKKRGLHGYYELIDLKQGKHTLTIFPRESLFIDLILIKESNENQNSLL